MSLVSWALDHLFRLVMWFALDDFGRNAFWFINSAIMLSCITYLYLDFRSNKDS